MILTRTRWGLHTVSVGGNLLGAREAGIKVNRIKIGNFMMCAGLGALAGILEAFQINIIDPSAGQLQRWSSSPWPAGHRRHRACWAAPARSSGLLGVLVLAILQDGFNLIGISANQFQIILGAAILLAMIANVYLTRLRSAGRWAEAEDDR